MTLDPDTAYPYIILFDDGKQVYHSDVKKKLPDNSERFTRYFNVLGNQSFFSDRFNFEVQVTGKTVICSCHVSIFRKTSLVASVYATGFILKVRIGSFDPMSESWQFSALWRSDLKLQYCLSHCRRRLSSLSNLPFFFYLQIFIYNSNITIYNNNMTVTK